MLDLGQRGGKAVGAGHFVRGLLASPIPRHAVSCVFTNSCFHKFFDLGPYLSNRFI
jgi:hypothetical protein